MSNLKILRDLLDPKVQPQTKAKLKLSLSQLPDQPFKLANSLLPQQNHQNEARSSQQ